MNDEYLEKYIKAIKESTDEELKIILNKLYEDGFQDGYNEN